MLKNDGLKISFEYLNLIKMIILEYITKKRIVFYELKLKHNF